MRVQPPFPPPPTRPTPPTAQVASSRTFDCADDLMQPVGRTCSSVRSGDGSLVENRAWASDGERVSRERTRFGRMQTQ